MADLTLAEQGLLVHELLAAVHEPGDRRVRFAGIVVRWLGDTVADDVRADVVRLEGELAALQGAARAVLACQHPDAPEVSARGGLLDRLDELAALLPPEGP